MMTSTEPRPISVAFITLGCAKNEVDSEKMRAAVLAQGWLLTDQAEQADCLVINTCAFITEATEEAITVILEASEWPSVLNKTCRIIVAGCLPSRYPDQLASELPEVAAWLPVAAESQLVQTIVDLFSDASNATVSDSQAELGTYPESELLASQAEPVLDPESKLLAHPAEPVIYPESELLARPDPVVSPGQKLHASSSPVLSTALRVPARRLPWAYLKIAEGCSRRCAFCTIPDIRGPFVSMPLAEILVEADQLVEAGARELVLIAQDTGLWHEGQLGLPDLLELLANRYTDVWLRVMYLQPSAVSDYLLEVMAAHPNICNYLDIPLQHAASRVLKQMNRSGSGEDFLSLIARIRQTLDNVVLRTTLIAGFPGETRAEARELERFVEAAQFDYVGVFVYSAEAGTPAGERPDQVPLRTRRARAQRLRDLADTISLERWQQRVGQTVEVLVCEQEDGQPVGRSQAQAPEVDGIIRL
ncbi:MAG: 30S ribosomal protein S12 methylthiotransferase RimO, partial [Coriobacteriales bacterium]|nr:30S ribosomal protein S12 methylthiotransferase RimO [Coriobacteriales bacterium]